MKRAHIPRLRYRPRHRGGWFRGYNGPTAAPAKHEGATKSSPLPTVEVRAVGEDPLLTAQIEIHHEVSAEAAEEERRRVELAEIEERTKAELDAIFTPYLQGIDRTFNRMFGQMETGSGLPVGSCQRWYLDAVHRQAEAEEFAREIVTSDLHSTITINVDAFNKWRGRVAEAALIA